jgi:hypothetical protein
MRIEYENRVDKRERERTDDKERERERELTIAKSSIQA